MANVFTITISAVDRATATVRKINASLSRATRPFAEVGKSFKSLGRELGFEKIGKNLSNIGHTAAGAARSIGSIVAPMAALSGVGTVAGLVALTDSWANLGRTVRYAAQGMGVSTTTLQEFQGASKLAGTGAEAMTSALQSLGDTMQDALYGRNQQALMLFNRLGVGIKRTKDGAVDAAAQFRALASAIYRLKTPQQQTVAAREFGLTALLPLIRQGPQAFDQLIAKARELGMVMDGEALKSANQFAEGLAGLKASGEGLRNTLGNALIPAIKPLVDQLTVWVSKNRELIGTKLGEWARGLGQWLQSTDWKKVGDGIRGLVEGIGWLVDKLGGLKNTAIAVAVVMNASLVASVVSLTGSLLKGSAGLLAYIGNLGQVGAAAAGASGALSGMGRAALFGAAAAGGIYIGKKVSDAMDGTWAGDHFSHYNTKALGGLLSLVGFKDNRFSQAARNDGFDQKYGAAPAMPTVDQGLSNRVMSFFQSQGWSPQQSAGIAANLVAESGLNPNQPGDSGQAYGIAQWHADRQAAFARWAGKPIQGSSLMDQLKFVQHELTAGGEQGAGAKLRGTQTAAQAAAITSTYYERPKDTDGEAARRGALAEQLSRQSAPAGPYSQGVASVDGKVTVDVNIKGAPPGTQARAQSQGNADATAPRVSYTGIGALP